MKRFFYPETAFGGFTDIDGTIAFYTMVNALVTTSSVVIDYGCGRGGYAEDTVAFRRTITYLKGKVQKVIGVDIDSVARTNPGLDEFRLLANGDPWPVDDKSADLIVCDSVIEHLREPDQFFREANRVLAIGGYLCIRTPNALSYIGVAARVIPNKHHEAILGRVQTERKRQDIFPTVYRCNTIPALRRKMRSHGFQTVVYGYESEPSYLSFSSVAYALGVLHQKFAPSLFRPVIFAFGQMRA